MKKILPQTKDITDENVQNIAQLLPQVVTESTDESGNIKKVVDFELLKQHLSDSLVDGSDERYRLDWPGKRASILKANTPINKTLRPDRESSVNFDTTENVYIEGDNFEVLKVLQESYLSKIKMIYIDPPYNTGKDFVYKDDYKISKDEYEDQIGVEDSESGKLFKNTDTNGRFHSDWLSMMYERLIVARDLLTDDGVIFMSIDDNEVHNLRKIADEIFGEDNFILQAIRKSKTANNKSTDGTNTQHEYLLVFSKSKKNIWLKGEEKTFESYKNPDNDDNGEWIADNPTANLDGRIKKNDFEIRNPITGKIDIPPKGRHWNFSKTDFPILVDSGKLIFKADHNENERGFILKRYKKDVRSDHHTFDSLMFAENAFINSVATKDINKLLEFKAFDYTKPVAYIQKVINSCCEKGDIILDFFSGSASTAHATMQLNADDDGNRKFIMVQLPEETDEKSEVFRTGYKTISEIGMERIRRAGNKIVEENAEKLAQRDIPLDIGFRVYKTDSSNIKDVYYNPAELKQENLLDVVDNIKDDRTSEDLLTQVILDLGLTLDLSIETKTIDNAEVFYVAGNSLVACFDADISDKVLKKIAESEPIRVVFRDSSFKQTEDKINVETIFKSVSPDTKIIVL